MSLSVPRLKLSSGFSIPVLGLGTWLSKPGQVKDAVVTAIDLGYRHIDCALVYGNEEEVGDGIRLAIDNGIVKREDLFVTTKCWNTYHSRAKVLECCKTSLASLKLDYLDLYLIHWPMGYQEGGTLFPKDKNDAWIFSDIDYLETWKGMEDCEAVGLTRSIGLSNFNLKQIQRVLDNCSIRPAMLQVECHPYLTQSVLLEFCKSNNMNMTAYSPLGSPDRPMKRSNDPALMEEPRILALASKYDKTVAQVLICYQIQRGVIVIPKSVTKERMMANTEVFDFEISSEDMKTIGNLGLECRFLSLDHIKGHPLHPFRTELEEII